MVRTALAVATQAREPAPRWGRRGGRFTRTLTPIALRSGAKRCSSVWKKASPWSGWPVKWAWAEQLFEAESAREKAFVEATRLGPVKVQ
jgi:hypothetical protein